jgi:outer membrane protein assembly factor BamB
LKLHGIKWKFNTGAAVISTPAALYNGRVYFTDGNVYAIS